MLKRMTARGLRPLEAPTRPTVAVAHVRTHRRISTVLQAEILMLIFRSPEETSHPSLVQSLKSIMRRKAPNDSEITAAIQHLVGCRYLHTETPPYKCTDAGRTFCNILAGQNFDVGLPPANTLTGVNYGQRRKAKVRRRGEPTTQRQITTRLALGVAAAIHTSNRVLTIHAFAVALGIGDDRAKEVLELLYNRDHIYWIPGVVGPERQFRLTITPTSP